MRLGDIPVVCEIENEAFATPWTENAFHNELTNNHFANYLIMEVGGEIAGYGGMWLIVDEAHVTNVAVRAPYRGHKLGYRLMHELQTTALYHGMLKMTLEVRVSNHIAQSLYRKMGFYPAGIRPQYYSDNNEDALIMWADLQHLGGPADWKGGADA
ncbi:ribosomal protein S18-alanine N-acetyltransferase [Paenibacillus sp. y28]|uniref:ribosomal protein S18-alanine N-acetyltransferase n=1 Tax=Paenibacillus sp. y28 TaxID=3129110 RepID=UPI003017C6C5